MKINDLMMLDGATGTMLQKRGLRPGQKPEVLNVENPRMLVDLHKEYIEAGSQILNACTFGASRYKLRDTGCTVEEVVQAAMANARQAMMECGRADVKVTLDMGPIGQLLEPAGSLSFDEAVDMYAQTVRAGVQAGADLIFLETFTDLYDLKAAVLACKENSQLPVFASMSFEEDGRTFMGCTVESMAHTLESLGVQAVGFNCSTGPDKMIGLVKRLRKHTRLPIIVKPNAGLPDPVTGQYDMDPVRFQAAMKACVQAGADIIGGCCGTTPDHIRPLTELRKTEKEIPDPVSFVCTPSLPLELTGVHMVGERINPTGKKRFQQALREKDFGYIVRCALDQQQAGASMLDVNVGFPGVDEEFMLAETVRHIQAVCPLPLMLDSSSVPALEKALRIYNGKPVVNSVNGKAEVQNELLPIVKKYGAAVVGLCVDEEGVPQTAAKRLEIADRIVKAAAAHGIGREDVWIDALTLTVSAQQEQAAETLKAIEVLHGQRGLQCVLGVSNISFGLPNRPLLTSAFLTAAMQAGLTVPIVNPNMEEVRDAVLAFRVLTGQDDKAAAYIRAFGSTSTVPVRPETSQIGLHECIVSGLESEAARATACLLEKREPLQVVENILIPALDVVGQGYEAKTLYLPQLLASAQAAQAAFGVIRDKMAETGAASLNKGTIVMATVKGDIHDIGKNIVKTVLENYGYRIVDLGKDVDPEKVVQAAIKNQTKLVGLSALMTTTLPAMEETTKRLLQLDNPPAVMVGGAVVTPEFAKSIGAIYSRDANDGVAIAREVYGD